MQVTLFVYGIIVWVIWVRKVRKVLVDRKSLPSLKFLNLNFCKYCLFGKQCRQKFKTGRHVRKSILDYIHSDVWGPSSIISFGGSPYFVTFIDDYSRKVWIYLPKNKLICLMLLINLELSLKRALEFQSCVWKHIMEVSLLLRNLKIIARKLGSKDIKKWFILLSKMVVLNTWIWLF